MKNPAISEARLMGTSRWYEPPEPVICCFLAEDEDDHDCEACMAEQAENAAEDRAERIREARIMEKEDKYE